MFIFIFCKENKYKQLQRKTIACLRAYYSTFMQYPCHSSVNIQPHVLIGIPGRYPHRSPKTQYHQPRTE